MGKMHAKLINSLTQPMALAKIDKGIIERVNFNFSGNDYECGGKLLLLYQDLKISLLKKNVSENKYNKWAFPSLAANLMILHSKPGIRIPAPDLFGLILTAICIKPFST
jgi:hypothetical protein